MSALASIEAALAKGIMRLPDAVLRAAAGAPREIDGGTMDLRAHVLMRLMAASGSQPFEVLGAEAARDDFETRVAALAMDAPQSVSAVNDHAQGPAGPIPVRIYRPQTLPARAPVLVYYHGGGWVIGGLDSYDAICRRITEAASCITVSVDYRLAPEHRFPAAVDDAVAAFRWVAKNVVRLGGDPARIAVGGDSAGGNLSAVVSLLSRDEPGAKPCFQWLIYPAVDMVADRASYDLFPAGVPLTTPTMRWFIDSYLDGFSDRADIRCSPLRADSLAGLPPACITTAAFDPLRDEGIAYATALAEAGVDVEHHHYPSLPHGYVNLGGVIPACRRAAEADIAALVRALRRAA